MRHAAKTYASTLAMLQLDTILRYSVKFGKPKPPKRGVKNQEIFTQMQEMRCELVGIGEVKMMVGIKRWISSHVFSPCQSERIPFGHLA